MRSIIMNDFIKIRITSPEDLLHLHSIMVSYKGDFTVHLGNISVDGKSLVGLMAFSQKTAEIYTTLQDGDLDSFKSAIEDMIID